MLSGREETMTSEFRIRFADSKHALEQLLARNPLREKCVDQRLLDRSRHGHPRNMQELVHIGFLRDRLDPWHVPFHDNACGAALLRYILSGRFFFFV